MCVLLHELANDVGLIRKPLIYLKLKACAPLATSNENFDKSVKKLKKKERKISSITFCFTAKPTVSYLILRFFYNILSKTLTVPFSICFGRNLCFQQLLFSDCRKKQSTHEYRDSGRKRSTCPKNFQ